MEAEFWEQMKQLLGEEFGDYRSSLDRPVTRGLLVNGLKISPRAFRERFPVPLAETGFDVLGFSVPETERSFRFGAHPDHAAGLFYMQEPSAMIAAAALLPHLGKRVLDLCAAPGGKTVRTAIALGGEGFLVANEIRFPRARILQSNVERMGIRNAAVTCNAPEELAEALPEEFDTVIADAPCSGEGMFRKSDEAVRDWSPATVQACARRQSDILDSAARLLAPGGILLYSTCTLNTEENEKTVFAFLDRHPEFVPVAPAEPLRSLCRKGFLGLSEAIRVFPHEGIGGAGGEGHFACLLRKKGTPEPLSPRKGSAGISASLRKEAERAWSELIDGPVWGIWRQSGPCLAVVPEDMPDLAGLRVLSAGTAVFSAEKGRLEPCHALALALPAGLFRKRISLAAEGEEVIRYLRGESLRAEPEPFSGYGAVCADGFALGWAKCAGGVLKNHYPKGLRRP